MNDRGIATGWQLGRDSRDVSERLCGAYASLREHFGYAGQWWPGTALEITLTALLVQQCNWTTAYKAVARLKDNKLFELPRLAKADPEKVRSCIHPVLFAPTKSRRLIQLAQSVLDRGFGEIESYLASCSAEVLRQDLLSFVGIGEETADCILLYAGGQHPSFVIDSYTRRLFRRLRLFPHLSNEFWKRAYGELKAFFESHLLGSIRFYDRFDFCADVSREVALFRDFHAQIVELGKHHCLKTEPRCRTRGADGWKDYFHCANHCAEADCGHCPLIGHCGFIQTTSSSTESST